MEKFTQGDEPAPEAKPAAPSTEPKPDPETPEPTKDPADPTEADEEAAAQAENPLGPGKKVSPWKLVNHYKSQHAMLQKEVAELRTNKGLPKEHVEQLQEIQKRNEELEKEISFVNYRKSKEFIEGYQKPYQNAWQEALNSLNGLEVQYSNPETGQVASYPITYQDIQALVNMEPGAARQKIKAFFPEDASEVKQHVDKIRALTAAQNAKLEEHETNGVQWMKQQQEQHQKFFQGIHQHNREVWEQTNKEHLEKFEFLRPVDGQDERNERLTKAVSFVDDALRGRGNDPQLSPEERAAAVRKYVAVRNRAIGYSVLNHENKTLKQRVADLEKNLAEYQASEPTAGDGKAREGNMVGGDPIEQALAGLGRYSR